MLTRKNLTQQLALRRMICTHNDDSECVSAVDQAYEELQAIRFNELYEQRQEWRDHSKD